MCKLAFQLCLDTKNASGMIAGIHKPHEKPKFPVLKGTVRNGITQAMCLNGYHRKKGLCNPTSVTNVAMRVQVTIFSLAMVTGVLQAVCTSLP